MRWVFDLETTGLGEPGRPPDPVLAVLYNGERFVERWGPDSAVQALQWLLANDDDATVWAHYGGGFDYRFWVMWLLANDYQAEWLNVGSILLQARGQIGGRRLTLNDSIRLLPGSLRTVGGALGLPKLDQQFEHTEPSCAVGLECPACAAKRPEARRRLASYCRRDCQILWKGLVESERRLQELGDVDMRITLASSASAYIRGKYGKPYTPHGERRGVPDVDAEIAPGFFGGRVEIFRQLHDTEDPPLRFYDIRSSYPTSMAEGPLPWKYRGEYRTRKRGELSMVDAEVEVPESYVPVLPYRLDGGRVYFPTGRWRGWFTGDELEYAEEKGLARVTRVYGEHRWEGSTYLGDFARMVWERRERAEGFEKYWWKILINSVFGKTVEGREHDRVVSTPPREIKDGCKAIRAGLPLYAYPIYYQPPLRSVATGSWIVSRARVRLHRIVCTALERGGRVYYLDTDCCPTTADLSDLCGPGLGQLDEQARIQWALFLDPKLYCYVDDEGREHVKAKGLPRMGIGDVIRYAAGAGVKADRSMGFREGMKRGDLSFQRVGVTKFRSSHRPKRRLLPSGETRPWCVRELSQKWVA